MLEEACCELEAGTVLDCRWLELEAEDDQVLDEPAGIDEEAAGWEA